MKKEYLNKLKTILTESGLTRSKSKRYIRYEYHKYSYGYIQVDPRTLEIKTYWLDDIARAVIEIIEDKLYA